MTKLHKLFISKGLALVLSFLLLHGDFCLTAHGAPTPTKEESPVQEADSREQLKNNFTSALKDYNDGSYEKAAAKLKVIVSAKQEVDPAFKAKVYLLLGACFEKIGKKGKARNYFLKLKRMSDEGVIEGLPEVPGIEPESLSEYREVFAEKPHFEFKKPVDVSDMLRKNVVHAPRKSKEQKEKEKKKKKFPWLIAVGAVVIIGTVAVLLLTSKKSPEKIRIPEIEWVKIPAGDFLMGDNFNEGEADELPVHQVYLDDYYISKFEIRRKQYEMFCEATGRRNPYSIGDNVTKANFLSWMEAKYFCDWLSEVTNQNIHLPTEAQWEKAARGTDQRRYPWGNDPPDSSSAYNSKNSIQNRGVSVGCNYGTEDVSPYGVLEMASGLSEWCQDWYSSSYYSVSPGKNPTGPASGSYYVLRGGNFKSDENGIRSANRDFRDSLDRSETIGFRIVKEE